MIYTVTLNPSLDYIIDVKHFEPGMVNRTTAEKIFAGGKGINVSMVLKNLGFDSTALGFLAGFTGKEIERQLEGKGISTDFICLEDGISRINMKIRSEVESEGIKGLLMPALDQAKRSAVFRAAESIPGVGNVFGGITDTIVGSGVLIKSAIGVGGIIAIALICLLPLLKLGLFTFFYRVIAAFSQPVADRRMVAVFQGSADSGKLLFQLVFMTAVLFLLTLTIIIAATN